MNAQSDAPGVVGSVAELLDAARSALSLDPRAAARYASAAAALLRLETAAPNTFPPSLSRSLTRWQLARTLELFEANFHRPITLDEVANEVRMSKSHFSRGFRVSMGEPPCRYLRRYRVKRAHEMMLSTSKPLSEIALNCGFADQSHFSRIFSRLLGVGPAAWRRGLSRGPGSRTALPAQLFGQPE
jgi:transcriptional regulator GlxA family with amidase domain